MIVYQLLNIIIFIVGLIAVLYLLFRLFAWHQGDARFVIEARRRQPFALKSLTAGTAVFETEVPCLMNSMTRSLSTPSWQIKQLNGTMDIGNRSSSIPVNRAASALRLNW